MFETKFLEKYKEDKTPGDLMFEVLKAKQTRGQSVDDYMEAIHPKLTKVKNLSEEMRVSLVINGFLPIIQDHLRLQNIQDMKSLQTWARRIERMSFVQKGTTLGVNVADELTTPAQDDQVLPPSVDVNAFGQSNGQNKSATWNKNKPQNNFRGKYQSPGNKSYTQSSNNQSVRPKQNSWTQGSSQSASMSGGRNRPKSGCWICSGPHLKRNCPRRQGYFSGQGNRGHLN